MGLALWLLAAGCVACVSGFRSTYPGDRLFEKQAYEKAAEAYEQHLRQAPAGRDRDRLLFRLGMSFLLRTDAGQSPEKALVVFERLLREHPHSEHRHPAATLIEQLRERIELQATLTRLRRERSRLDQHNRQLQQLQEQQNRDAVSKDAAIDRLVQERDELTREMEALRARLTELQKKNTQLAHELDELKKIDMQRAP